MLEAEALLARLTQLEADNRALRERLETLEASTVETGIEADPAGSMSRRSLLRRVGSGAAMLGIGAIGASVAALGAPAAVLANGEPVTIGGTITDAMTTTAIRNHVNDNDVLLAASSAGGLGVHGYSALNAGVYGDTLSGDGVRGVSLGDGIGVGVRGESVANIGIVGSTTSGIGVQGISKTGEGIEGASTSGDGVHGFSNTGHGVSGFALGRSSRGVSGESASASGGTGVWGEAASPDGVGVRGYAWDGGQASGRFGTGVIGSSGAHGSPPVPRANTGVMGVGTHGRGGVFSGDVAQIELVPAAASTHPGSGARGDLFVDKSGRLWFCKGGRAWKQLA